MDERIIQVAKSWLGDGYDEDTKAEVRRLLEGDSKQLEEAFYKTLEFGTGGLRGIMGAGCNRMNRYTVGMATQGFANYLKKCFAHLDQIKVAVSYDCRNNSATFSRIVAEIFEANGFHVYLTKELRPTPELSYAIRHFGCQGGVMVTASHNPKIYNGYKAYWEDGAQVIAPHDKNIIEEVNAITDISQVKWTKEDAVETEAAELEAEEVAGITHVPTNAEKAELERRGKIELVGEELDDDYLRDLSTLHVSPESVKRHHDLGIVYTPLHGCGVKIVPRALREMGFTNVHLVEEQCVNSGDFPTVQSPNPEEPTAMKMALDLADKVGAEIVCASDPDADRCGIAVRDENGKLVLLNGNQMNCILTYYMLRRWKELGRLNNTSDDAPGTTPAAKMTAPPAESAEKVSCNDCADKRFPYIIKTIVTSNLMSDIADHFQVKWYNVLTGFKNIAEVIHANEGKGIYICGGEESFGFAVGEFVRDKDSPITVSLICECAAWCKDQGTTVWGLLQSIYKQFGERKDWLRSYTFPGIEGKQKIDGIVEQYRTNPPTHIGSSPIIEYRDYLKHDYFAPEVKLAKSNVLQYTAEDGTVVSLRPSGTEPKIKFYFNLRCNPGEDVEAKASAIDEQFAIH